ncbi:MAG: DUF3794 domain-containing protein [Firmicutes bacterium]|nr:DUF3794 domain-containing protein [Bacillota bacterium]
MSETVFEVIRPDSLRRCGTGQAVVEARLAPVAGTSFAKILSISTTATASLTDVFKGEARYGGRVNFCVIYADEEGRTEAVEYAADFTDKVLADSIENGMRAMVSSHILDTDTVSVAPEEVKIAAVVEVFVDGLVSSEIRFVAATAEGVYNRNEEIEYSCLTSHGDDSFVINDDVKMGRIERILSVSATPVTRKVSSGIDTVMFDCLLHANVIYLTDDGVLRQLSHTTPFVQEAAASGAKSDDVVMGEVKVKNVRAELTGNENIRIDYSLSAQFFAFGEAVAVPVTSVFSVGHELISESASVALTRMKGIITFDDRVEGSATLDVSMPAADVILSASGTGMSVSSSTVMGDKIVVEGVAGVNVVYYNASVNTKNAVSVELPFSLTFPTRCEEGDSVVATGRVTNVSVKIRRGNEMDIRAEITLAAQVSSEVKKSFVTSLELGEALPMPTTAFSIYVARPEEDLWDLARALECDPEQIKAQNPDLTLPLMGGERVMVYRGNV